MAKEKRQLSLNILIFGDSHSVYFEMTSDILANRSYYQGINIDLHSIKGSTIQGFGKRESTLSTNRLIIDKLNERKYDKVVFAFGQVDVELGLYYKLLIKEESLEVDEYIGLLVDKYLSTVKEVATDNALASGDVIIKAINSPVLIYDINKAINYTKRIITENIDNHELIPSYTKKLKSIYPSAMERRDIHSKFNAKLKVACEASGFTYLDLNHYFIDDDGFINEKFIPAKRNHHLVDSTYVRLCHIDSLISLCFPRLQCF